MASALGFILILALAGALLHLGWHLVLATLIWAPSAAGAIGVGWSVATWTGNAALGIGVAILAATMIRAFVARALAWLWAHTFGEVVAR
jgi:hypothetical protein